MFEVGDPELDFFLQGGVKADRPTLKHYSSKASSSKPRDLYQFEGLRCGEGLHHEGQ